VHWTQSNQLLRPEAFAAFADERPPGMLHVHPFLFAGGDSADGKPQAEILTFGARHFIGREIRVPPSPIDWFDNFQTILAFLRVATMENGYIVPDGDTFGTDNGEISCLVRHVPVEENKFPLYEIEPLLHRKSGFVAPGYLPQGPVIDDQNPPQEYVDTPDGRAIVAEWRDKRRMVEGIGGKFSVRMTPEPRDDGSTPWLRKVFGKRR
jgi:hypothetical protein